MVDSVGYRVDHCVIACMSTILQGDPSRLKVKSACMYVVEDNRESVVYVALNVLIQHGEQRRRDKRNHEQRGGERRNKELDFDRY
jgi:hypothetical protein